MESGDVSLYFVTDDEGLSDWGNIFVKPMLEPELGHFLSLHLDFSHIPLVSLLNSSISSTACRTHQV